MNRKCAIIRDLFPKYIDGLTCEESNQEIEQHLKTCEACRDYLEMMKQELVPEEYAIPREYLEKDIHPFKKYWGRTIGKVLAIIVVIIIAIFLIVKFLSYEPSVEIAEDYQGPNFPLAIASIADGILAERTIVCDYSDYDYYSNFTRTVGIQDQYVLKNTTSEDITLELAYGFTGNYGMDWKYVPQMMVNGEEAEVGLAVGRTLLRYKDMAAGIDDFTVPARNSYEILLANGEYQKDALEADRNPLIFSEKAQVFKFENIGYDGSIDYAEYPIAKLFFDYDPEKTKVYSFGMDMSSLEFHIPQRNEMGYGEKDVYLIAVGEEIQIQDVKCYRDINNVHELEELTKEFMDAVTLVEYETTLEEVLKEIVSLHRDAHWFDEVDGTILYEHLSEEEILKAGKQYMSDVREVEWYSKEILTLEGYLFDFYGSQRVFYRTAEITIPANSSAEVVFAYEKHTGIQKIEEEAFDGLEIMTTLGTELELTSQTLKVVGAEELTISEHTTGDALEHGECEVEMQEDCFEIYLEIPKRKAR